MERLIGRKQRMSLDYIQGDCQICRQHNVKVRKLECGYHMYCRMCAEFIPRLAKGDIRCKICNDDRRRQERVDDFLLSTTGSCVKDRDFAIHIGDTTIVAELDDGSDDNEEEGNNSGWDHLLQSIVTPSPNPHVQPPIQGNGTQERNDLIPKKTPFMRLVLPSVNNESTDSSPSPPTQMIPGTVTQLLLRHDTSLPSNTGSRKKTTSEEITDLKDVEDESLTPKVREGNICRHKTTWTEMRNSTEQEGFDSESSEEERCTSPCKARRMRNKMKCVKVTAKTYSQTEIEELKEEIGSIEGPGFSTSSSRSASLDSLSSATLPSNNDDRKSNTDDFWDM